MSTGVAYTNNNPAMIIMQAMSDKDGASSFINSARDMMEQMHQMAMQLIQMLAQIILPMLASMSG